MQDQQTRDRSEQAAAAALAAGNRIMPSSSRMLTGYLADTEQLLDVKQWDAAVREALELPTIAVALSDPGLAVTPQRLRAWCDAWIRPQDPDSNAHCADYQRVSTQVLGRASQEGSSSVPVLALKKLRLHRHARSVPRGFSTGKASSSAPEASDALETCRILVEAARRWYAHSACHDPVVQANLSRLAVLR